MDKEILNALVNVPLAVLLLIITWQNYQFAMRLLASYEAVINRLIDIIENRGE